MPSSPRLQHSFVLGPRSFETVLKLVPPLVKWTPQSTASAESSPQLFELRSDWDPEGMTIDTALTSSTRMSDMFSGLKPDLEREIGKKRRTFLDLQQTWGEGSTATAGITGPNNTRDRGRGDEQRSKVRSQSDATASLRRRIAAKLKDLTSFQTTPAQVMIHNQPRIQQDTDASLSVDIAREQAALVEEVSFLESKLDLVESALSLTWQIRNELGHMVGSPPLATADQSPVRSKQAEDLVRTCNLCGSDCVPHMYFLGMLSVAHKALDLVFGTQIEDEECD